MTPLGHEDQFAPTGPNGRCRFGQETFARVRVNGRDAPEAVMSWQPAGVDVAPGPGHGRHSMNRIAASALGAGLTTTLLPAGNILGALSGWLLEPMISWRRLFLVGLAPALLVLMIR